ncbi:O-antigen acetylase [Pseudomonas sp. StFLB209]|uniref:acyltransferase family protein n=1 Tax=Pseudomonas sp. StFLB209 TaxID=1028989 RepID=UPI0004F78364|nr:acyltransferase family protein [Pseudomonas sp. StFLB209]BAP46048.1 O-antigen acetylase [Pseudomonas sp. StFLB209]
MTSPAQRQVHYPYIDGLRAIAVIAVILYHLKDSYLPGGFAGVDVFFVISGFVVSSSMANFQGRHFFTFVTTFYARRMRRILPALLFCVLVTGLVSALFIPASWLSDSNEKTGLFALFGLSNFILADTGNAYFSPKTDFNPFTHTWSLGVEEQFYFVFPILFFVWVAFARLRWLSVGLFVAGLVASLVWAWGFAAGRETQMFYMLAPRFWELAAGVLCYQAMAYSGRVNSPRPATALSSAGVLLGLGLIGYALWVSQPAQFPFPGALPAVAGLLCVLVFGHGRQGDLLTGALSHWLPVAIGKVSYSLYLWHWPVFVLMRWTVGLESLPSQLAAVLLSTVLAVFSYRIIEVPLRRRPLLDRLPNLAVISLGLLALAGAWGGYKWTVKSQPQLTLNTVSQHPLDWYPYSRPHSDAAPGCVAQASDSLVAGNRVLSYSRGGCDRPVQWPFTLYVVGDSHAMAYIPMLSKLVMDTGVQVRLYNNGGCPFMSFQAIRESEACRANSLAALQDITGKVQAGDVLFMPSLRLSRFSDQFEHFARSKTMAEMFGEQAVSGRQRLEAEAPQWLAPLAEKGVRLVFEAPKPIFEIPPFRCANWFDHNNPICSYGRSVKRDEMQTYRQPVTEILGRLAGQMPAVSVWDPLPVLCPESDCQVERDGRPLFYDADHVSGHGNMLLAPDFEQFINRL